MTQTTIIDLHQNFISKKTSPVEYIKETIAKIKQDHLNAITAYDEEALLKAAKLSEARYQNETHLGPLDGVPIGIKDLIDTEGLETAYGSETHRGHLPSQDAFVVSLLKEAGALTDIKTNTSQFALGTTGEFSLNGPVKNPRQESHFTGGSSSGSGAAVAAGYLPAALGTDTGGSIRIPAALCGIIGMKPTNFIVSRVGTMPLSDLLDAIGPMTHTVADNALLLQAISGINPLDWHQSKITPPHYSELIGKDISGEKVIILTNFFEGWIDPEIAHACQNAISKLGDLGVKLEEKKLSDIEKYNQYQTDAMLAFGRSVHLDEMATQSDKIYPEVLSRLPSGEMSAAKYVQAERSKQDLVNMLFDYLDDTACMAFPTTPIAAKKIGEGQTEMIFDDYEGTPSTHLSFAAKIGSFSGFPAISIPVGFDTNEMPIGLTLMGRPYSEAKLYQMADQLIQVLNF